MKIKVLALAFGLVFTASIATTSVAQVLNTSTNITVVDDDKDKNKKKTKTTDAKANSSCKAKKSCCSHSKLKDDCKDTKVDKETKSDKDKR